MALYSSAPSATFPTAIDSVASSSANITTIGLTNNAALLLPANPERKGFSIFNNSLQSIYLGINYDLSTEANFFAIIPPKSTYEWSFANSFTGEIFGLVETFIEGESAQVFTLN